MQKNERTYCSLGNLANVLLQKLGQIFIEQNDYKFEDCLKQCFKIF
jgi:hypothetical protein